MKSPSVFISRKVSAVYLIVLVGLFFVLPDIGFAQTFPLVSDTKGWETEEIAEGIYRESYHVDILFNSTQSIQVLNIDMATAGVRAEFAYSDTVLIKTSEFGENNKALAAVNGSFFDMSEGGSVVFFKQDDEIINTGGTIRHYRENGGVAVDESGQVSVVGRPSDDWHIIEQPDVLTSGPLMILDGEIQTFEEEAFNENRHPRTAVGITDDQRLLLVTVDGRSGQAHGMSIPELAEVMESLGAESALNLDGGGSTTMWINGKGVVNNPSDNGEFDHLGERGVANVLLIVPEN